MACGSAAAVAKPGAVSDSLKRPAGFVEATALLMGSHIFVEPMYEHAFFLAGAFGARHAGAISCEGKAYICCAMLCESGITSMASRISMCATGSEMYEPLARP